MRTMSGLRLIWTGIALLIGLMAAPAPVHAQVTEDLKEGDRYFEEGLYKKAAQRYDSAIKNWPAQVSAEAYGKRAAIFIIQKQYTDGLAFITERAEAQHPGAPDVLEQKALILWLLGRRDEAIAVAEHVVADKPALYSNQGIIGEYYAGREPARVIAAYEAYLRHRPESLEANDVLPRVRLGFAYLSAGRYDAAEAQFDLLLKKHRKLRHAEINARNGLCAAYTAQDKFDRAIALCEQIVSNSRHVDHGGSVWYNLGQAYLYKKQVERARTAGKEFIRIKPTSVKGYLLVGDTYFEEQNWESALQYYLDAEKRAKSHQEITDTSVKLGVTYRRLGRVADAIAKLQQAFQRSPEDAVLAIELGDSYLATKRDQEAYEVVARLLDAPAFANLDTRERASLLLTAARALYNQGRAAEAQRRYEQAYELKQGDMKVRIGLLQAITYQAYEAMKAGELDRAESHLRDAHRLDMRSPATNQNLAVLAISRGRCDEAKQFLAILKDSPRHALLYNRLLGRAYVCQAQSDPERAFSHYQQAERLALAAKAQTKLLLAEIYIEWAPLIARRDSDRDLDDAVAKLRTAVELAKQSPALAEAARRNLALALFRRGWRALRADNGAAAGTDFQAGLDEASVLAPIEQEVFQFLLAVAFLERGDSSRAARLFTSLAAQGALERYLKPPYDRLGSAFFLAYAKYRSDNSKLREQAVSELSRLRSQVNRRFTATIEELLSSALIDMAHDAYRQSDMRAAKDALRQAEKYASSTAQKRRIAHNQVVLTMMGRGGAEASKSSLEELKASIPEAWANLGILHDRQGQPKLAYEHWVEARRRGVKARMLQEWIDAKRRIFGF